jgi:thiazole synthase
MSIDIDKQLDDPLTIAGKTFRSRLLLGTGGFRSLEEMGDSRQRH